MTVRAVLLAGGLGSRLHPLTTSLPKPMVPVMGTPWLGRLVSQLDGYGFVDVVLGLHHRAEVVSAYFREGPAYATPIRPSVEPTQLGTGGAIRFSGYPSDDTVLVLNADIVQHFNLLDFMQFHRAHGGRVTVGVIQVPDTSAYGLVEFESGGLIQRFVEKPRPGESTSKWVNAGVYCFEPEVLAAMPMNRPVSVERETFPDMIASRAPIYAFPLTGYWRDIGTGDQYLDLHCDILSGNCPIITPEGREIAPSVWVADGAVVAPGARLVGPVAIGARAVVANGAHLGPGTVVGSDCGIGPGASVRRSVLWDGVVVDGGTRIVDSIVGYGVRLAKSDLSNALIAGSDSRPVRTATHLEQDMAQTRFGIGRGVPLFD